MADRNLPVVEPIESSDHLREYAEVEARVECPCLSDDRVRTESTREDVHIGEVTGLGTTEQRE